MTKYVTLAHRMWVNKHLKDLVKSKLTFPPSLDKTTHPQTNNTHRLVVATPADGSRTHFVCSELPTCVCWHAYSEDGAFTGLQLLAWSD